MISEDGEYKYEETKLTPSDDVKSLRVKKISLPNREYPLECNVSKEIYMKYERSKSLEPTQKLDGLHPPMRVRMSSIISFDGDDMGMGGVAMMSKTYKRSANTKL